MTAAQLQHEGYAAYVAGVRLIGNPYRISTQAFQAQQWINGWAWARTDHKHANRAAAQQV